MEHKTGQPSFLNAIAVLCLIAVAIANGQAQNSGQDQDEELARYTHASRYCVVPAGRNSNSPITTASTPRLSNVFASRLVIMPEPLLSI